jgi:hypothetical protein
MAEITGTAVLNMYGILLLDRRGCTMDCSDDPALTGGVKLRLTRVQPNLLEGTVEIDWQVFDPDECDAWDAATEEGDIQDAVYQASSSELSTPTNVTPVAYQVGGITNIDVAFDPGDETGDNINIRVEWRVADAGGGVPGEPVREEFHPGEIDYIADDLWIVTLADMPENTDLQVRVMQYRSNFSAWSGWEDVDTSVLAPGRPQNFTASSDGAVVTLDWDMPNSANVDHARVYRATSGAGFGLASDISGELAGGPGDPMTFDDTTAAPGAWDYWIVAETAGDISSIPTSPETETISFDVLTEADGDYLTEADGDWLTD